MLRALLLALLLTVQSAAHAQALPQARAANSIYLELLGNGGPYSVNYEREIAPRTGLRLGFATWGSEGTFSTTRHITVPLLLNYRSGTGRSMLELGGGVLLGQRRRTDETGRSTAGITTLTVTVGYRNQPPQGGFLFRIGFTPFYSLNDGEHAYPDPDFTPSAGASVGYAFQY
jgi:hypothetical protein